MRCCLKNPFLDVSITDEFTGPSGRKTKREAYWDGGQEYKVSFAPIEQGRWDYRISAPAAAGLDGAWDSLECVPYSGELPIYKHGLLKVGG